jgi:hypothetical protein
MLEPVCFCMDRVEFEFERLGEVELEQPVVAVTSSAIRSPVLVRRTPR